LTSDQIDNEAGFLRRNPEVFALGFADFRCLLLLFWHTLSSLLGRRSSAATLCFRRGLDCGAFRLGRITVEGPRRRKLSQLVPDHVFRNTNGDKFLSIMNSDGMTHHVGDDRRSPGPGLNYFLFVLVVECGDFLRKMLIDKWTFFQRAAHITFSVSK